MSEKLFDSELKIMEILWEKGALYAKDVCAIANDRIGWNKNTTYTILNKLERRGFICREEPGFLCTPLITRSYIQKCEIKNLLSRVFEGSRKSLFSALLDDEEITDDEIKELYELIKMRR